MLLGAGIALLTTLAWAIAGAILKVLTDRIDGLSINTIRMWVGALLLVTILLVGGKFASVLEIPGESLFYIIVSGFFAMAAGDTVYIRSIALLDVSIAYSISQCVFVVIASFAAVLLLGEPLSWITGVGAVLVMAGIYLIVAKGNGRSSAGERKPINKKGVLASLFAAIFWTVSTITLKIGAQEIDAFVVAAIRISFSAVLLTLIALARRRHGTLRLKAYSKRTWGLVVVAGIVTYGIAAVGYVLALQMIGAGKTVLLTTSGPLFALPISIIFLKERPKRSTIIGIGVSVAGVVLVVI